MPVKKYRSVEEMDADRPIFFCEPGEDCYRRIAQLWRRSAQFSPRKFPPGVIKYRTLEEADADRERWAQEHVRRVQEERLAAGKVRVVQRPGTRQG